MTSRVDNLAWLANKINGWLGAGNEYIHPVLGADDVASLRRAFEVGGTYTTGKGWVLGDMHSASALACYSTCSEMLPSDGYVRTTFAQCSYCGRRCSDDLFNCPSCGAAL